MLRIMLLAAAVILAFGNLTESNAQDVRIECPDGVNFALFPTEPSDFIISSGPNDAFGQAWKKDRIRAFLDFDSVRVTQENKSLDCRYTAELGHDNDFRLRVFLSSEFPPGYDCIVDRRGATCSVNLGINPNSQLPGNLVIQTPPQASPQIQGDIRIVVPPGRSP